MPTVAILGASADRSKFGNKAVRAFLARGYTVYPVNPKGGEIEGLAAYHFAGRDSGRREARPDQRLSAAGRSG